MSALTKVFIVLQVVLAILLVAGQIVFVNKTEDWKRNADDKQILLDQANRVKNDLVATDNAVQAGLRSEIAAKGSQLKDSVDTVKSTQDELSSTKKDLADTKSQLVLAQKNVDFASQALVIAQTQVGTLQGQYNDQQKVLATLQKNDADNTLHIADLTSRLEATERERRYIAEQLAALGIEKDRLETQLKQGNVKPGQTTQAPTVTPEPTTPLVGQVSDTRMIDGIPYCTINIGSADQVASGMRFSVVDPTSGTFLGFLKVEQVEPHAASGRILDGPHVNDVHAGNEVRTQL